VVNDIPAVNYYKDGSDIVCQMEFEDDISLSKNGLDLLVQNVVLCLMSSPNDRDVFEPKLGGGLRAMFSPANFQESFDRLRTNLPLAVKAVDSQIKAIQIGKIIPDAELLKSLSLDDSNGIVPLVEGGFIINLKIVSMANEVAVAGLPLVSSGGTNA
jgi:hypothetical protein